jgi:hypothetical protein
LKVINNNLVWSYSKESEQISPEQPYRLNTENRDQITKDDIGDMSQANIYRLKKMMKTMLKRNY